MDGFAIGRMHTRYRLPARGAEALRARLDGVQSEFVEGALEGAVEAAGAGPGEEVCVRRLHVPVRLRGARGDSALAADWAAAVATALGEALARGDDDLAVRYGSRLHAWMDCALGVAQGRLGRAWAWRRLGLWRGAADLGPADAATELVRGLVFEPQAVVAVLVGLAGQGALLPLARRLDAPAWTLLAAAALDAHQAPRALLEPPGPAEAPAWDSGPSGAAAAGVGDARAVPGSGDQGAQVPRPDPAVQLQPAAGSALADLLGVAVPEGARAMAVLVLLAADPALGRRGLGEARRRLEPLVQTLLDPSAALLPLDPDGAGPKTARATQFEPETAPGSPPAPTQPGPEAVSRGAHEAPPQPSPGSAPQPLSAGPDSATAPSRPIDDGAGSQTGARQQKRAGQGAGPQYPDALGDAAKPVDSAAPPHRDPHRDTQERAPRGQLPDAAEAPADPGPEVASPETRPEAEPVPSLIQRRHGRTQWGGLLLLLNCLEPAGLLTPEAPWPPGRTLRWGLHRLAQALAPVAADDPAALAFAGLAPGSAPPSLDGPDADPAEAAAIAALAERVAVRLHAALGAGAEHPGAVLARICRRPAEILADPGWIEVRFPLDCLSTQVRRAGLDLNPDWLPWLGVVVRFAYE